MNLTHRQFEILAVAAETESFSAAAQRLGISQPSLSESIRRIEHAIGWQLFERTTRSVRLTDKGRYAAVIAREVVRDFSRALEKLSSHSGGGRGRITIAALPSIASAAMPAALGEFRRDHPAIDVDLRDVQHERALSLVSEGIADLAVTIKPTKQDGLIFAAIMSDVAHLVCRTDNPLARRKHVRWRDLKGVPFIGMTPISSVRRLTDAAFVHAELAIEPGYEVEQISSAVALVEAGLGVTALPSLTFSMLKGRNLAVRPLIEPRLRRNVGFVTLAGRNLPDSCDALMRTVREKLSAELRTRRVRL